MRAHSPGDPSLRSGFRATWRCAKPIHAGNVDPTCHQDLDCSLGPYNVVWSGDAFLVIYFATLHLGEPTETTEMRMVRLVPET